MAGLKKRRAKNVSPAHRSRQNKALAHAAEAERHKQRAESADAMLQAERTAHRATLAQLNTMATAVGQAVRQYSGMREFAKETANNIHAPMGLRNSASRCLNALDNLMSLVKPLDINDRTAYPPSHEPAPPLRFGQQSHPQAMVALWVQMVMINGKIGTPEMLAESKAQLDAWRAAL